MTDEFGLGDEDDVEVEEFDLATADATALEARKNYLEWVQPSRDDAAEETLRYAIPFYPYPAKVSDEAERMLVASRNVDKSARGHVETKIIERLLCFPLHTAQIPPNFFEWEAVRVTWRVALSDPVMGHLPLSALEKWATSHVLKTENGEVRVCHRCHTGIVRGLTPRASSFTLPVLTHTCPHCRAKIRFATQPQVINSIHTPADPLFRQASVRHDPQTFYQYVFDTPAFTKGWSSSPEKEKPAETSERPPRVPAAFREKHSKRLKKNDR